MVTDSIHSGNPSKLWHQISRKMPIEISESHKGMLQVLNLSQVVAMGISSTIGTGIFFILGTAVPQAGPAVIVSFVIAGIAAILSSICYGELASAIPKAGSSYYYAYTTLGEFAAVLISFCMILEYGVCTAAVSVGWGEYINDLLTYLHLPNIPHMLSASPWDPHPGIINLPALVLVVICAILLCLGVQESARVNLVLVVFKLLILGFFILMAFSIFDSSHFTPFASHGISGITAAGSQIFFSFVGFDAIALSSEETKKPHRNIPRAIVITGFIVLLVYILITCAAIGAQSVDKFTSDQSLGAILFQITHNNFSTAIFTIGAITSMFAVTLVTLYQQSRSFYAMGRDSIIPSVFSNLYSKKKTPLPSIIITAVFIAILAGFVPLDNLADAVSLGTIAAFITAAVSLIILRKHRPDLKRSFKVPFYPYLPVLAIISCCVVAIGIKPITWAIFGIWLVLAIIFYFAWGRRHSNLEKSSLLQ